METPLWKDYRTKVPSVCDKINILRLAAQGHFTYYASTDPPPASGCTHDKEFPAPSRRNFRRPHRNYQKLMWYRSATFFLVSSMYDHRLKKTVALRAYPQEFQVWEPQPPPEMTHVTAGSPERSPGEHLT
jgi:hypothetical protein